jgi:predicted small secreted protein
MIGRLLLALLLLAILASCIGCQTVQGVGRDISWVGEKGSEIVR